MNKFRIRRAQVDSSLDQNSYKDIDQNFALVDVCVSSGCFVYGDEFDHDSGRMEPAARGLEISEKAIRFDRLNSRAPVLDNHNSFGSIHDQVGSVERAWISAERGIPELFATLRISKISQKEKEIAEKIRSKIITSVSVGADIFSVEDITEPGDEVKRTLAVDWEPVEVSLVPVPADSRAVIRSLDSQIKRKYIKDINQLSEGGKMLHETRQLPDDLMSAIKRMVGEEKMSEDLEGEVLKILNQAMETEEQSEDSEKEEYADDPEKKEEQAGTTDEEMADDAEKEEMSDDTKKEEQADDSEKEEMSEEEKKTEMKRRKMERSIEELLKMMKSERSHQPRIRSNRSISVGKDHRRSYLERSRNKISDALCERIGTPGFKAEKSNEFRHMTMSEMFREMIYREGTTEARHWDPDTVFDHMNSRRIVRSGGGGGPFTVTSDLANLFSTSVNKSVQQSYEYMRGVQTFDPFVKRVTVKDFQTQEEVSLGEFGKLQETPPGSESPVTPISDDMETWRVKSYTNIFRITRQGFVNDNTGELENVLTSGAAAADLESDLVYEQLNSGTVGGRPWARAGNNNLTTGAPLGDTDNPYAGLKAIYEGLARQTGLDVDTPLNLTFKYLIVPVTLFYAAAQSQGTLNGIVVPTKTGDLNPFAAMYKIVKEPRLDNFSTSTYYGIAGEANLFRKFLVLGTLSKGGSPKIKFQESFSNDVLSWKLTHDVGAKVLDYRLAHKVTA